MGGNLFSEIRVGEIFSQRSEWGEIFSQRSVGEIFSQRSKWEEILCNLPLIIFTFVIFSFLTCNLPMLNSHIGKFLLLHEIESVQNAYKRIHHTKIKLLSVTLYHLIDLYKVSN